VPIDLRVAPGQMREYNQAVNWRRTVRSREEVVVRRSTARLAGCGIIALALSAHLARAAGPDLRLVDAAARHDLKAVRALLEQDVDPDASRADGVTALLWAAHWDDLDMADALLGAGADVSVGDDYGVTPLARAAENASHAMVEKLLLAGADPNIAQTSGLTPLMIAARTGSVTVTRALLAHGAGVNATTIETNATALMWAVAQPHRDIVRVLLEAGGDVGVSTKKGFTPLMFAAQNGDIDTARLLLGAGADVNARGSDGTHVLPYAMVQGEDAFALFLLEEGADPKGTIDGITALHAAAGHVGVWLADWTRRHGGSGLGAAYGMGGLSPARRLPLVKALLARGADPNARITTSAMIMSYVGYPKKGAFEPYACGTGELRGATPLWVAAFGANGAGTQVFTVTPSRPASSAEIIRTLLAAGADPHLTTSDGTTPLMAAAGLGRATYTPREPRGVRSSSAEEAVRLLLEAGADIDATNEADFTALHGAAFRGLNEVVQILVEHGADINARDFKGRTAYRLAEGAKQSFQFQSWPETAELLARLGADTRLGIPGTVQERARDLAGESRRYVVSQDQP